MGVFRRLLGRETTGWKAGFPGAGFLLPGFSKPKTIQKSRSERGSFPFGLRRRSREKGARGLDRGRRHTGRSHQPKALNEGEHHVRTLHREGTARDLLRAV
jgi:hypothetical protein